MLCFLLQNSFYTDNLKMAGVHDVLDVETKYEYVAVVNYVFLKRKLKFMMKTKYNQHY